MHGEKKLPMELYTQKMFKKRTEEQVPTEEMKKLLLFAEVETPGWGENMKPWIECDKVRFYTDRTAIISTIFKPLGTAVIITAIINYTFFCRLSQ